MMSEEILTLDENVPFDDMDENICIN